MWNHWSIALVLLLVFTAQRASCGVTNLLQNPSFEDDLRNTWRANGFTMERYREDVVDGSYSIRCRARKRELDGPIQKDIPFVKGAHYVFEGYAKLLDDQKGKIWQNFKVSLQMDFTDGSPRQSYIIAYRGFVQSSKGWIKLKGSIEAPMKDIVDTVLTIRGPDRGLSFLLDNLTLYEVPENPNWSSEAHRNIDTYRKSNVKFNVALPKGVSPEKTEVEISLKKHQFIFGAKIEEYDLVEKPINLYTRIVYNLFNWAAVQAYKWRFNKGTLDNPDFSRATEATDALLANGLKVRGHSILWDVPKNVPEEVVALRTDQVQPAIIQHIRYMMNLTRGKLSHFDVQNEMIHGHYYEERLQDPEVTKNAFRLAKAEDPNGPVLYLNDFTCVTSGANTEDLYDLAMEFKAEGVPIEGLGCQGHTKDYVKPDPTNMWRRIDRLAETGLEVTMTEFDIGWPHVVERADWLEDSIRAFFGHPAMTGVILWGFWNESMRDPHHELLVGPTNNNLKFLESGERFACLTKKEWTTKVTRNLKDSGSVFSLRAFQGDYEVIVKIGGVPVQRQTFKLGKEDTTVNIAVSASNRPIAVTAEEDFVPECISHRAESTIGTATTSTTDAALSCRTVWSNGSGPGCGNAQSVMCSTDEVMTSCSSVHMSNSWTRNGEKMELTSSGHIQCTAYNGRDSPNGVRAFARCCKTAGLVCDYKTAGPSLIFDGAMAEARCDAGKKALGCSAYQPFPDSDGVKPAVNLSSCLAQSGVPTSRNPAERSGVTAFAACCKGKAALDCRVVTSQTSEPRIFRYVDAVCPPGYEMTGCNGLAEDGSSAGSSILVPSTPKVVTCRTTMGSNLRTGSFGVRSYATCCRVDP